ncbi:MAG: hypothetical protein K2X03_02400 [Bryobacteraceae bacterium]|nr:hypothetical protein [Bryobacteraceae bacterium]
MHLRVLIDGKTCRLSERTKRRWVCPNAPDLAGRLCQGFSPRPHDPPFEYREVLRIIGRLTEHFGDRLVIKAIGVKETYTSIGQREVLRRLCGRDGETRPEPREGSGFYLQSKVDFRTEVPISAEVDLDLLSIEEP